MMGGSEADEFMTLTESGEDTLIICSECAYKANKEVAKAQRSYLKEEMLPLEEVATPGKMSIEEVAQYLNIKPHETLKALVYSAQIEHNEIPIMCVIRGDLDINETKLRNYLKIKNLVFASNEQLAQLNIIKGFASPLGQNIRLIVDESAAFSSNLTGGANKIDYHIRNINFNRDYSSNEVIDISSVNEGERCPKCSGKLEIKRGIEVGNIFKLGTKYSEAMSATFLDKNGKENNLIMGCYGIGIGRLLASVLEVTASASQIIWPISIAPFEVELLGFHKEKDQEIINFCHDIYRQLQETGIDVLYDDRNASAGYKFKDADLIGSPIKIALGSQSLQNGGAELIIGNSPPQIIKFEDLIREINKQRSSLYTQLSYEF
jgi:prolyl-tRNA synthetase